MTISDYTVLPVGTEIDGGVVEKCPYCLKNGLKVSVGGKDYFNHRLAPTQQGNSVVIVDESCPVTHLQRKTHEEAQLKEQTHSLDRLGQQKPSPGSEK
jgi:hypothetical protein